MLPPAVRAGIIARITALVPTTAGATAYAGSVVGMSDVTTWTECTTPITPTYLPATTQVLSAWVELGAAEAIPIRGSDSTKIRQEVAVLWLYPLRNASEAEKADFDRAWYSMAALYEQIVGGTWSESGGLDFTVDRVRGASLQRPVRLTDIDGLLCELRFFTIYDLGA